MADGHDVLSEVILEYVSFRDVIKNEQQRGVVLWPLRLVTISAPKLIIFQHHGYSSYTTITNNYS